MTAPEEQRHPVDPQPSSVDAEAPRIEAIAIDELDKENRGWVTKYLDGLKQRLADEQAADQPDFTMIGYLKRELATYQELLERTDGKK